MITLDFGAVILSRVKHLHWIILVHNLVELSLYFLKASWPFRIQLVLRKYSFN